MSHLLETQATASHALQPVTAEGLKAFREQAPEAYRNQLELQQFKAAFGKCALLTQADGRLAEVLVGMEKPPEDPRASLILFARLAESLPPGDYHVSSGDWSELNPEQAALGWGLAGYHFATYLRPESREWPRLFVEGADHARVNSILQATFQVRDLVNMPASDLGPAEIAAAVAELGSRHGAEVTIVSGERLEREYPAVHAVGKGSARRPALADLRWGNPEHPRLTLVGKGVAFDSGGLDLKPSAGMLLMKKDMGGAAVALGLARLIMEHQLPVRLRLLIPTVENSVSGHSFRPGDVLRTRKGLTVEVGNTDAEGRLILCDALAEAMTEQPDLLIDMATLTGACRTALGQDLPGYFTADNELAQAFEAAAERAADPIWRLPLWRPYLSTMKSPIADLNNMSSSAFAGASTAALFLQEFVRPFSRWIHVDLYAWRADALPGFPKGGEASALRALFQLVQSRYS